MALRRVHLPPEVPGQLWLGSMPGRFEAWSAFEAQADRTRLRLVVCLTPRQELAELSPDYHAAVVAGRVNFRWQQVAMRNFGVPEDPAAFRRDIANVVTALQTGDAVLLHCAAGLGRTGTAAACVLKALGLDTGEALQRVREAGSNPQNAEQSGLVDWF
ncbi:tyrosine-protein phosphatase [Ramlibacter sp. XY19]|uniref:protein-tyrosine phosphatase family protein n=1 Tax=Ramlibacter paludis TaxID=2908000 RepID=UPI0023DCBF7A|nr:tyrosine-protein phosphatase [Ramlibacter paludis]MCG2594120.1 tyrosine-protein phosphatase [Ramlibacter paludis]